MKKATRLLLAERPKSRLVNVVKVHKEYAKLNECQKNAMLMADEGEAEERFAVTSGWLVGDFLENIGTALIPHFWVYDVIEKKYFDPTPVSSNDNFEYVEDFDIALEGLSYEGKPPPALRLDANGNYYVRKGKDNFEAIKNINIAELYSFLD
jgi:hypothetical protein